MTATQIGRRWAWLLVGVLIAHASQAQQPTPITQVKPTPLEMTQLPQYCWATWGDAAMAQQPEFRIPAACGPRMNHFCPALLAMIRASDVTRNRDQRRFLVSYAEREVQYTLNGIPPACPILADVRLAERRTAMLVLLLK